MPRAGYKQTPEHRAKLSAARRGKSLSAEHRAAIAASKLGRPLNAEAVAKTAATRRRKGCGYTAAHHRVLYDRGPARDYPCVDCSGRASHWSFRHSTPRSRTKYHTDGAPFSLDVNDYDPRCQSCHQKYDRAAA